MPRIPSYRKRKDRNQALVTLTDAVTKRRRDYWLGEYGTPESRERYHRLIAEWEANGRRLPHLQEAEGTADQGMTVAELIAEYWRWASSYYNKRYADPLKVVLRLLRRYFGHTPASAFGPKKLRMLRETMIHGDPTSDPPRKPWSRRTINLAVGRIRHLFKWAASHELVPVSVYQSLCTVEPLRRGRSAARETEPVRPVPEELLQATLPHLSRPVRALVELQLLTGARPGELLGLRPCDIEFDEETGIWTYRPESHKNAFRGKERVIYFGPRAQQILRPFLSDRPTSAYCFSPAEADAERRARLHEQRKTPLSCGNRPETNVRDDPKRKPGDRYTTDSYRRAIEYACEKAFPPPARLARREGETKTAWLKRLRPKQKEELAEWRRAHRWHPHQLRHNAATLIRRQFGLEAAQLALGHASALITDAVYAERDREKVIEIMRRIG